MPNLKINNLEFIKFIEFFDQLLVDGYQSKFKKVRDLHNLIYPIFIEDIKLMDSYHEFKRKCLESNEKAPLKEFLPSVLEQFKCKRKFKSLFTEIFQLLLAHEELEIWMEEALTQLKIDLIEEYYADSAVSCNNTLHIKHSDWYINTAQLKNELLTRWLWWIEYSIPVLDHLFNAA